MKATGLASQEKESTAVSPGNGCFLKAPNRKKAATKRLRSAYSKGESPPRAATTNLTVDDDFGMPPVLSQADFVFDLVTPEQIGEGCATEILELDAELFF